MDTDFLKWIESEDRLHKYALIDLEYNELAYVGHYRLGGYWQISLLGNLSYLFTNSEKNHDYHSAQAAKNAVMKKIRKYFGKVNPIDSLIEEVKQLRKKAKDEHVMATDSVSTKYFRTYHVGQIEGQALCLVLSPHPTGAVGAIVVNGLPQDPLSFFAKTTHHSVGQKRVERAVESGPLVGDSLLRTLGCHHCKKSSRW